MPLTDFVDRPAMREAFKANYLRPTLTDEIRASPVRAPSCGHGQSAIGTAFDYLARFLIARHARRSGHEVADCGWLAEKAVGGMSADPRYAGHADLWRRMMEHARRLHEGFVDDREPLERVVRCVQVLGQADLLYRLGEFKPGFTPSPVLARELTLLAEVFDPSEFMTPGCGKVLLNPGFGRSDLTGGADADVIAGSLILDFKTVPEIGVPVGYMRQLVGYSVLHALGGACDHWGPVESLECRRVGLYFGRHGVLLEWPLEVLMPDGGLERYRQAFLSEAGHGLQEPGPGMR